MLTSQGKNEGLSKNQSTNFQTDNLKSFIEIYKSNREEKKKNYNKKKHQKMT